MADKKFKPGNQVTSLHPEYCVAELLEALGENQSREGLLETPQRHVNFLRQFLNHEPFQFTTFTNEAESDEMIIMKDIPFYSLCEHHLVPFFGTGAIGYIPNKGRIVGLSKLARVLDMFSRRFQNQERITQQTMAFINKELQAVGVGVVLKARHLCVEMRGIKKPGSETITSAMCGRFKEDVNTRQEFLNLIK